MPLEARSHRRQPFQDTQMDDDNAIDDERTSLTARLQELEQQLLAKEAEAIYYRRIAKIAGDERLREAESYSRLLARMSNKLQVIETQHHRLEELHREIKRMSITDDLTQLLNRRGIVARLQQILANYPRDTVYTEVSPSCHCALLDISDFKHINDLHGHSAGDEVLRGLGHLLRRTPYLTPSDIVGRYSGEEILIILPDHGPNETLETLQELIDKIHRHRFRISIDTSIRIRVNLGIAAVGRHDSTAFNAIDRAYRALYRAKREGSDPVRIQTPELKL
jgi:diguanylate cyclase (GGDEF)-like protein